MQVMQTSMYIYGLVLIPILTALTSFLHSGCLVLTEGESDNAIVKCFQASRFTEFSHLHCITNNLKNFTLIMHDL